MGTRSIRINDETHERLFEVAGRLQSEMKRPVSVDETIKIMIESFKPNKISDLAGKWNVSDEEIKKIRESLKDGWRRWSLSV